ncbi:MAG TPA: transposase [Puia sp.]|jgi:REP element-mobilizing transposase RayT|nr:transposase [Puia sp.]
MIRFDHNVQFVTITNLNWLPVLNNDFHKQILLEALNHRVKLKQVSIYAFVIMPNHFHAIWQLHDGIKKDIFQRDLLKFTARSILKFMLMNDDPLLDELKVNGKDREYQVWERNSLSIDILSEKFFLQKFNYVHSNPLQSKWKLAATAQDYKYSSASFYETGNDEFGVLENYIK